MESCPSGESMYQAMAETAWEMVWLRSFLKDLNISSPSPMSMHCDDQAAIFIAVNFDYYYIQEKVMSRVISTPHETSSLHLTDALRRV